MRRAVGTIPTAAAAAAAAQRSGIVQTKMGPKELTAAAPNQIRACATAHARAPSSITQPQSLVSGSPVTVGGKLNSFVEISTDFPTDFSTEFL